MCGISGIFSLNNDKINYNQLVQMTMEMNKRGPDGGGYLISNDGGTGNLPGDDKNSSVIRQEHLQNVGLGHRRLSITDLSREASQPMCDAGQRYWIVFNGQIYNHVELRRELESLGYRFKTDHSDTEVILNAYDRWGTGCLEKFNGTWAFCLWDTKENNVFIARDRMGVRPLYYTIHDKTFYFASELNAIVTNRSIARQLDEFAIYDYLTYTNVPAPNTIFKHIKKIPAAHYLLFKPGEKIEVRRYWSAVNTKPRLTLSEREIITGIHDLLDEATRTRMATDVEVGMLLSGGLDSSINLALMNKHSRGPVKTYTVGFENSNLYKNEFEYARNVASFFKAEYNELAVSERDFFDFLPEMAYLQDEPIADPANIPIYFISKQANKDGIKVLLGGEGSDELFIGYQHWRLIYEFEKIFRKNPRLANIIAYLHRNSIFRSKRPHYQTWAYKLKNNWPTFWSGTELRTEAEKHRILSREFMGKIGGYNSLIPIQELYSHFSFTKPYDTFEWMTVNDLQHRLPDQLLARLDRMMMAASIEGRHPFLDVNLIDFTLRIPAALKVKQKTEKYLLKKAFEDVLPHEIVYRAKDSFTVPLSELFKNPERKKEHMDVIFEFNKDTGIFLDGYIKQLESPKKLKEFWNVLNLALWYQNHK